MNLNDVIKVRDCADVLTRFDDQYFVVIELKEKARSIKQTKAIAQLLSTSALESSLPVLAIGTDLNLFHELCWLEKNNAGLPVVHCLLYQYGTRSEFFSVVRAFIASSLVASPGIPSQHLSSWLRKDSGFDSEYDEDRDGRQGRTLELDPTNPTSLNLRKQGSDR